MSNDRAETSRNTEVAAATDKQSIERNAQGVPALAATPKVRPWTSKFLLPSIRFRPPKRA
jgi:hypothetical protein